MERVRRRRLRRRLSPVLAPVGLCDTERRPARVYGHGVASLVLIPTGKSPDSG